MEVRTRVALTSAVALGLVTALVAARPAWAESPLTALGCDPVDQWVAAGAPPTVRTLANNHGWAAFEAVRGKDRRIILRHPPDDGESALPPWGNLDAPAEGACYIFRETERLKAPKPGSFGPVGGTHGVRLMVEDRCDEESCAWLLVGLDAAGAASSTVVITRRVVKAERVAVFEGHDSLLLTAETDAGAGFQHLVQALVHDAGNGLAPLLIAEIGVREDLAPSERAENRDLRCWRRPAGWLRVETRGAAPVVDVLEPDSESENGEGLGTGRRGRWVWSPVKKAFERTELSKHPYDARAACRRSVKAR